MIKLLDIAEKKIEGDLNVVKIIKHLRELRVLVLNDKLNDAVKFQIDHNKDNILDLENSDNDSVCSHEAEAELKSQTTKRKLERIDTKMILDTKLKNVIYLNYN